MSNSKKKGKSNNLTKRHKKWVSPLYRTAQPLTLAIFQSWGSSVGAGRIRLTHCKSTAFFEISNVFFAYFTF